MVSIIKNQLLKHLSRFTKNLSADKINLSAFKGEGELTNLELNETVLSDLLELPSWLTLRSASCNKVSFRIQWTQLKKVPIQLNLDTVLVVVETCEELRTASSQSGVATAVPGKYSFVHKIIDGITVNVNIVNITFNSPAFTANVDITRIILESKNPKWQKADLRTTRLKVADKGHILIFKELQWQNLRIEAKSIVDKKLTPLRLLTNEARCRIVIKKRLSDSFVMGSRLVIILDDLLWVLTDSQLKAALHFLDSLSGLVEKATNLERKEKAARKLEELPEYRAQLAQQARAKDTESELSKMVASCDVIETSYHFLSHKIVLHLSDDDGPGRSVHPSLQDGGGLQIVLQQFQVDYYPYHLAKTDRKHWARYKENGRQHVLWLEQSLTSFRTRFFDLIERNKTQHTPLTRANKGTKPEDNGQSDNRKMSATQGNLTRNLAIAQFAKLMTSCIVMRIEDFTIYKVTTSGKKQALREFISGDRDHMMLPDDAKMVHAEFTYFYYPDDSPFPLPPPKFYVKVNPIQIVFDVESCLWLNSFALHLHKSLINSKPQDTTNSFTYIDVKIEAILPRIVFESSKEYHTQKDRPRSLTFQVTRATITNVRSLEQSSRADLAKCVDSFHMGSLFFGSDFPSKPNDFYIVTQKFLDHISAKDNIRTLPNELDVSSFEVLLKQLSREFMWLEAKDVWCINLEPVWGDFIGARACSKPVPFLDAVPITVWVHTSLDPNSTIKLGENESKVAEIHALAYISNLVSVQINHYQYLFLLRLAEDVGELSTFLSIDSNRIMQVENNGSLILGALIPQLEVTFVMPSQYPGKESSGGDAESFIPDSSSIGDDILVGSNATVWQQSSLTVHSSGGTKFNENEEKLSSRELTDEQTTVNCVRWVENYEQTTKTLTTPENEGKKFYFDTSTTSDAISPNKNINQFANLPNNFNVGLSSMKKGFSNLMTSLDSALKPAIEDSDTMSTRSDVSSDSENYVMVLGDAIENENPVDGMFTVFEFMSTCKGNVEIASEVIEEDSTFTTTSEHSLTSSYKRKDLVSVATFKLNKVEFIQQSMGYSSSIKVQVSNITNEDCISIPWDEFQSKFSSRARAWSENPSNSSMTTRVKLRLDHNLTLPSSKSLTDMDFADKNQMKRIFSDFVDLHVRDLNLILSMSTVTGLADLAEDEIIPVTLPLQINLNNIELHLNEDRPPVNITSPGPVPIDLNISKLFITRDIDGIFHVHPSEENCIVRSLSTLSDNDSENKLLKLENEELKRRLVAFERISEENRVLRKSKEETDVLRTCLSISQDEVGRLLDVRRKLLDDIKQMHEQNDRSRQWTGKR